MTPAIRSGRGRPLRFFALLSLTWTAVRVLTWTSPFPAIVPEARIAAALVEIRATPVAPQADVPDLMVASAIPSRKPLAFNVERPVSPVRAEPPAAVRPLPEPQLFASGRTAAAQNLIWAAAMRALPLPAVIAERFDRQSALRPTPAAGPFSPAPIPPTVSPAQAGPWHFDAWFLGRGGAETQATSGTFRSSLGGSQAGAMLGYSLSDSWPQPRVVVRLAGTPLAPAGESSAEISGGVRARPIANLPAIIQVEGRILRQASGTRFAPAAFVAGGIEENPMPLGLRLRAYGEAGWVGGDLPTGFADGQLVVEREVADFDLARLDIGGGAWGGIQRGAARLDVGPSLSLRVSGDNAPVRLQVDYRVRIAGGANPGSGPAVTLSTGF